MIAEFIIRHSNTPSRIGTLATRELKVVEGNGVPDQIVDEARAVSMDKKTTQRTVISINEMVNVTYVFPLSELELDDEFRKSGLGSNDTVSLDCTSYPWINRTLVVSMESGPITTELLACGTAFRRSFAAMVLSSTGA